MVGQVENDGCPAWSPGLHDGGTDGHRVIHLGAGSSPANIQTGCWYRPSIFGGSARGSAAASVAISMMPPPYPWKDHLPLEGGGGVVKVENDVLRPSDGVEGLADEMLPGLDQHLDGHVVRDVAALDELPADFILRLGGGGKPTSIPLKPMSHRALKNSSFSSRFIGSTRA